MEANHMTEPTPPEPTQRLETSGENYASMGDAAFPQALDGTHFNAVGGYLRSPQAFNPWPDSAWAGVPGPKLPIWVAGMNGMDDANNVLAQLAALHVPVGSLVAVDMEERIDVTYVNHIYAILHHNGYKMWLYGSADFVFRMPRCNGYWVADYAGIGPFMYAHQAVRATQWTNGSLYDQSTVRTWCLPQFWQ